MFVEKLNKKQEGVYVIEEEKTVINGIWEGYLNHDNANRENIVIYTEPNFTGEKVDNYFISTPSEMPWKTYLKVFSESEKIYITYETTGDQVEAEDINLVQGVLVDEIERATSEEKRIELKLDNEIVRAIAEDEKLSEDVEELKEKKADKVYVDTELTKVYKKDEVFTKEEVLQKIEEIIDAAPEALNTLGKLAEALDNDPNFATNIINLLSTKVDKVAGKGLSTNDYTDEEKQKLAGIEDGANKYVHPSTHPASIITESSTRRFVSDDEKNTWNTVADKADKSYVDAELNKKAEKTDIPTKVSELEIDVNFDERYYTKIETDAKLDEKVDNSRVLTDVPANAKFTDTITTINGKTGVITKDDIVALGIPAQDTTYSEISEAEIDIGTSSTKRVITGRRVKYILDKVQGWINSLTKADIGLGNVDNVKQATKVEFDAHNNDSTRHITSDERNEWNNKANKSDIPTKISQLENDENYVTQEELGDAGYGDMLKSIYDTNDNGKVDIAELADNVPWTGITNKPSTFPPSSHNHSISDVTGLQEALDAKMEKAALTWNDLKGV